MDKIIAKNKEISRKYEFLENFEAGIKLTGPEVKSCKLGQINMKGSYASFSNDGLNLLNCHISRYRQAAGHQKDYDPLRPRLLLLRKKELNSLIGKLKEKRLSLVPVSFYLKK